VISQLQVAINVRLSFFNRDWFNAIQTKDSAAFWSLLFGVYCFWAAIYVVSNLVEYYTESVLKIRWRRWMTERYYGLWLDDGGLYRTALVGQAADNPDQRTVHSGRDLVLGICRVWGEVVEVAPRPNKEDNLSPASR
jgi:ABC-type uncharacterized transport system fused permease/ATPase subunit